MIVALFCSRFALVCVIGKSMVPALASGNIVLIDKQASPRKGDIVVADVELLRCTVVKRVAAEGGDTVEIQAGKLIINGECVEEPYVLQENADEKGTWKKRRLASGTYFLLGDNRKVSLDSRKFGCVRNEEIKGTVVFRLF